MDREFEFDVAFSFLQEDESIAFKLHNLIKDTVKSFIYSEQQKKLSGTDGELKFNEVFSKESRIVVILYRNKWGTTPWTRVEETAIRNRGHDEGYDFTILIPMDVDFIAPKWLPKNKIWIGLKRWGIESAASVIEARITEYGGTIRSLTTTEKLRITAEEAKSQINRDALINSDKGFEIAKRTSTLLIEEFKNEITKFNDVDPAWQLILRERTRSVGIDIISYNHQLVIQEADKYYGLRLIRITIWKGVWGPDGSYSLYGAPSELADAIYKFNLDKNEQPGWSNQNLNNHFITNTELVGDVMVQFIETVKKKRMSSNRGWLTYA